MNGVSIVRRNTCGTIFSNKFVNTRILNWLCGIEIIIIVRGLKIGISCTFGACNNFNEDIFKCVHAVIMVHLLGQNKGVYDVTTRDTYNERIDLILDTFVSSGVFDSFASQGAGAIFSQL